MPILITVKDPDLWVDPDFRHEPSSIGKQHAKELCWIPIRRLNENALATDWHIFDGIEPADLLQGAIGDCWLISAMAVLAEFPETVKALFVKAEHRQKGHKGVPKNGMYEIRLFDHARMAWRDVTVDEYVPYQPATGLCEFAKPHGNEVWVLVLEKAMAKLFGSYSALEAGNPAIAFRALTGEPDNAMWERTDNVWKEKKLKEGDVTFLKDEDQKTAESEAFFETVRDFAVRNYLMCASLKKSSSGGDRKDGLVDGSVYSMLMVVECDEQKLVKLRNPWGSEREWTGAWSDKDGAWTKFANVKERLRPTFGPDGIFWMAWSDFSAIFSNVYVCYKTMQGRQGGDEGQISRRMNAVQKLEAAKKEVQRIFALRDTNGDKLLDEKELANVMEDLGMEGKDASRLLKAADANKDGKVDLSEFLAWILESRTKTQKKAFDIAVERSIRITVVSAAREPEAPTEGEAKEATEMADTLS